MFGMESEALFLLGIAFATVVIPSEVIFGGIADKYGKARVLRWAAVISITSHLAFILAPYSSNAIYFMVTSQFLNALSSALKSGTDHSLIKDSRGSKQYAQEDLKNFQYTGRIAGAFALLLGVFLGKDNPNLCLYVALIGSLLYFATCCFLIEIRQNSHPQIRNFGLQIVVKTLQVPRYAKTVGWFTIVLTINFLFYRLAQPYAHTFLSSSDATNLVGRIYFGLAITAAGCLYLEIFWNFSLSTHVLCALVSLLICSFGLLIFQTETTLWVLILGKFFSASLSPRFHKRLAEIASETPTTLRFSLTMACNGVSFMIAEIMGYFILRNYGMWPMFYGITILLTTACIYMGIEGLRRFQL